MIDGSFYREGIVRGLIVSLLSRDDDAEPIR